MKHTIILIYLLFFSSFVFSADLKVKIKPYKDIKGSEFSISLERYNYSSGYYSKMDKLYNSINGIFKIEDLNVGRYMIAIMHPSSEILLYHIYIPKENSKVEINVELENVKISKQIDSVRVVGKSNKWSHWKNHQSMVFDETEKVWKLKVDNTNNDYGEFYFLLNRNEKTHSTQLPVASKTEAWADFHNYLNEGENEIIFNPALYNHESSNYKIKIKGNNSKYNTVCKELRQLKSSIISSYSRTKSLDKLYNYRNSFNSVSDKLDLLELTYKKDFPWLFASYRYDLLKISPIELKKYLLYKSKKKDEYNKLKNNDESIALLKKQASLLHGIDYNDLVLTRSLIQGIARVSSPMRIHLINEELNIPFGYFDNLLEDILKDTKNDEVKGEILYLKAYRIKRSNPKKASEILNSIIKDCPNYSQVKNGRIKKTLLGLSVKEGLKAPNFNLVTLEGTTVTLDSFKGKYVFLDFWGTWCPPCRGEIPNIKKLREEIPEQDLVILGVACRDTKEKVEQYAKDNNLNYLNAISNSEIQAKYGINSYPTTFLIDKEGKIIRKNLRGFNLSNDVKRIIYNDK
ncbi:peroxiredoxin family protein [Seonamhaeicola marinus]|uniref:TlpA family protein disulfide reductase n=1 Tax=Seonamhaeicola marinus TaxID=1912246 RepID=A0A5D0IMA6_9FLAO|nr:TlpA disulfide reductase family protein [Seonamhaeicola marinus]TYA84141.1 TlpA family protein disulfide reductase [Seonamhaeicola marinus]